MDIQAVTAAPCQQSLTHRRFNGAGQDPQKWLLSLACFVRVSTMIQHKLLRFAALGAIVFCFCSGGQATAMGGAGTSGEKDVGPHVRKLKLSPIEETPSPELYGWVRISQDQLSLGVNHIKPDSYYTVYFVNGDDKQKVGKVDSIRSSHAGEAKFQVRLTEPLGARWAKLVVFLHTDNKPKGEDNLKPMMEASLR